MCNFLALEAEGEYLRGDGLPADNPKCIKHSPERSSSKTEYAAQVPVSTVPDSSLIWADKSFVSLHAMRQIAK
jgi:hypothetical protein